MLSGKQHALKQQNKVWGCQTKKKKINSLKTKEKN